MFYFIIVPLPSIFGFLYSCSKFATPIFGVNGFSIVFEGFFFLMLLLARVMNLVVKII